MASNPPPPPTTRTRPRKASTATPGPGGIQGISGTEGAGPSTSSAVGGPAVSMAPPSLSGNGGPTSKEDCEHIVSQLMDPTFPNKRRLELAAELRDTAEAQRDFAFYTNYLAVFIPALQTILGEEKTIAFGREAYDHRYRHTLLTWLLRLPHTDPFKPFEAGVMGLMVKLIKAENEENALICIKIMIDGFRAHKDEAEPFVEPFLDLVKSMYANTKTVVEKEFGERGGSGLKPPPSAGLAPSPNPPTPASDSSAPPPPAPTPTAPQMPNSPFARALHSPKVLTECPIAVVLIFQTWKHVMTSALLDFYPLVMESIRIQPEPQRKAHEEAKERGEIFVGVAAGIHNREMYTELIKAQVKTMAFLAYVLRGSTNNEIKHYLDIFPEACIRLLKDCPPEDVATRKELLVATRHILTPDSRSSFVPYIDVLLEEKVLVGTGITCREVLRPLGYSVVADLIHHVRGELDLSQLSKVVQVFSSNLNDPSFTGAIHTMCAKLLNTIIESISSKEDKVETAKQMRGIYVTCIEKMTAFIEAYDRIKAFQVYDAKGKGKAKEVETDGDIDMDGDKPEEEDTTSLDRQTYGWREIEQAMPIHAVAYADESLEVFCKEGRYLYKTLLHLFRTLLSRAKDDGSELRAPDGEQLGMFFEHNLRALIIFEGVRDPREAKEAIELFSQILLALDPHEFAEIWTTRMDFFVELAAQNMHVLSVIQVLITHQDVSHQLVGILLKYLMDRLGDIGSQNKHRAHLTLRLFKMSFLAINTWIDKNEAVLVPHLQKLIMASFTHAAKAADPTTYYHILRALFRSIGGGRFEALYKEVLPVLQEMLDTLAYLLKHATEETQKDLFTELTLTVPVRLTNLLPHLQYLMAPLVHALKGGHELVSQGLRTLELCIDNLTADFLDPNLGPVLRDLMSGLNKLLKSVPANRNHSHNAIKILGKLGGRNRRFEEVEYQLDYRTSLNELSTSLSIEGKIEKLQLEPLVDTAVRVVKEGKIAYIEDAVKVLQSAVLSMLVEGAPHPEGNVVLQKALSGLFRACQHELVAEGALDFVRSYVKRIFAAELSREDPQLDTGNKYSPAAMRKGFSFLPLTPTVPDSFVYAFEDSRPSDYDNLAKLLTTIIADFDEMASGDQFLKKAEAAIKIDDKSESTSKGDDKAEATPRTAERGETNSKTDENRDSTTKVVDKIISAFAHRFTHICHEEDWTRKMAGVAGLRGLLIEGKPQRRWVIDLEIDVVRALLYCLKDAPKESPQSSEGVIDMVKHFIRTCQSQEDGRAKQQRLMDTLVSELHSSSKLARESAQDFLALLAEVNETSISELVGPTAKAKLLDGPAGPIFNKPLRALPFSIQVGIIDAVTWLVQLSPSVVDFSDEYIRLFHEVLALADVDDQALIGKPGLLKSEQWLKTLRISCIRLLRSSMAAPEFSNNTNLAGSRTRVIQAYFKHVYSPEPEIVKVSFEGLKDVLDTQSKLPKDILQTGLRPILVNLADAKRLSVSGLDGLAKFLELLNNYFKVEIGIKLLDHFASLGDEQTLIRAAQAPLDDNPDIVRMSRLVNIFRLLPPSASQFLVKLVGHVVEAEARLHQTAPGPFTEVLAKYLDRYHEEACNNLLDNIRNPRYVWTYRNVLSSGHAPHLVETLSNRTEDLVQTCFADPKNIDLVMPGLHIVRELVRLDPTWLNTRHDVFLNPLVNVWRAILAKSRDTKDDMSDAYYSQMPTLILELFTAFLSQQRHPGLLSHVVEAFEIRSPFERSSVAFFLYQQVALQESVEYRQELIDYFLDLYDQDEISWAFKTNALRLVINPTLRLYFADTTNDGSMVSPAFIQRVNDSMWKPLAVPAAAKEREDSLLIEVFSLTTLLIQNVHTKVDQSRKEVFKFAWMGINLLEPTVKLTAYVLTATFMSTYDTPAKFIKLCWIGLLRLKESETRALYREALRVLANTLPKFDPPGGTAIPEWAQRVRSILIEEGQTTNQLVTVCELLVNHPDLFYDYRELYVPHIANSLNKLAFLQNATPELKKLSVDAVELIYRWERRRVASVESMDIDGGSGRKRGSDGNEHGTKRQKIDGAATAISASSGGGWGIPAQVRESLSAHLLRLVSSSHEPVAKGGLTTRALQLFKEILGPKGFHNVNVKLAFFQKTMAQDINNDTFHAVANSAEVIAAIAASKDQHWVRSNLTTLCKLLEKVWVSEETGLHEIVEPLTASMFKELPEDDSMDVDGDGKHLYRFVKEAVSEGLQTGQRASSALPGTLFLVRHWLKAQPHQLQNDLISNGLIKVLVNLVKVHTTASNSNQPDHAHRFIISILDIVRDRAGDLRDLRRHLNSTLSGLIERTTNITLCRYLLDLLRQWVLSDPDPTAQGKEKSSLLRTMSVFEQRGDDELFERYLDLIYDIYEEPALRGTDITHKLEPCFLLGAKSKSPTQRARFLSKLEGSLPLSLDGRLQHLYSLQNWDCISESYWIPQILSMLMALADVDEPLFKKPMSTIVGDDGHLSQFARDAAIADIVGPARSLIHEDQELAHRLWVAVFPHCWSALTRSQQSAFAPYVLKLLSKDFHRKQIEMRPNVIQTFLAGLLPCNPPVALPPLLIKWLAKTFNAWYTGFELLHKLAEVFKGDDMLRDSCSTALAELYSDLCEDDMFYGLARTRCAYPETTAALSYEQNGMWPKAIEMYEAAQVKARNGMLPFSEEEYCLWENHWITSAQKLQHWDQLTEVARQDSDSDLLLEAAWRLSDWGSADRESIETNLNRVIDVPTPRRKTFEAFLSLLRAHTLREIPNDFVRVLDEVEQVSLRKWTSLPSNHLTAAHLPLLQMFQQSVELTEASQVFDSLQMTNQSNLEIRANQDLKHIFTTWRERLPNFYDDIGVWSDLLAWRQHVFTAVTKVYVPLIPQGENSTFGYRGYHEQAWMINRFGEVARRHGLLDVCSIALNKIYSLPNIEISEAFLKLREQALCFFQKPEKFNEGLDSISTTNLMYFTAGQKSEFLTLKGMFISRLGQNEDANAEFAHAIQMDMTLPKAWAEWGRFNDKLYRDRAEAVPPMPEPEPGQPRFSEENWAAKYTLDRAVLASSAVSCYLQASGLYGNHKCRGLLLRVLWLLGLDDSQMTIAKGFENYKGDLVIWYWITLIPQLLLSLSHREARQARTILMRMAKQFPQSLFYNLRVIREEWGASKKAVMASRALAAKKAEVAQANAARAAQLQAEAANAAAGNTKNATNGDGDIEMKDVKEENGAGAGAGNTAQNGSVPPSATVPVAPPIKLPLDMVDEIINQLKTSFPLLALMMEKMVDHISIRAKPNSEEDIYRFFAALLNDAMLQWCGKSAIPNDDGELTPATKDNLYKFAHNLSGDLREAIKRDFMQDSLTLKEYILRLQYWRDVYERSLDSRGKTQSLDQHGCNLNEFHHTKFDEVDVPGQYLKHIDQGDDLTKIARFSPSVEVGRGHGHCFRRITMIGSDASINTFVIQMPAARHCRREDRLTAFFRIMNSVLARRKESRRRNLQFHLPTAVAFAQQLRLVQSDSTYVSLQDIYDEHCRSMNMSRDDPSIKYYSRLKELHDPSMAVNDPRFLQLKMEITNEIQTKLIPENILTNYMIKSMKDPESLWLMRKQFAIQSAANMFLTYMCCLHGRAPSRFQFSRKTGGMYMSEILPATAAGTPIITSSEAVPFRLTPNMQHFITKTGVEGTVTAVLTALSKSLTGPEFDLSGILTIFLRDEVVFWLSVYKPDKNQRPDTANATLVYTSVDKFIRRAETIGFLGENKDRNPNAPPAIHTTVSLISAATSPSLLCQMPESYLAWY